jgi:hypothetical protein
MSLRACLGARDDAMACGLAMTKKVS